MYPVKPRRSAPKVLRLWPIAAFAVALLVVVPSSASAGLNIVLGPPFSLSSTSNSTLESISGGSAHPCHANATAREAPTFNANTGAFRMRLSAISGSGPACSRGNLFGAASLEGTLTLVSTTFVAPKSGIHVFRSNWKFAWEVNLTTVNLTYCNCAVTAAGAGFEVTVDVYDLTSQATWTTGYGNSTGIQGTNASLHVLLHNNVSLPIVIPLTNGDRYYFSVALTGSVYTQDAAKGDHARASLFLVNGTDLERVTLQ
jgi:hypothetical protein